MNFFSINSTFIRNVKDKQAVLKAAQFVPLAPVSISEDVSRRTKESRQHLRRFLRLVRKNSPEKVTKLEYDVAFVDGVQYVYNEERRVVEEVGLSSRSQSTMR